MDRSPPGMRVNVPGTSSTTQTEVIEPDGSSSAEHPPVLRLRLEKPKSDKKVAWHSDTVDNEDMGKKKSKCCCIYKKPHAFNESSSESEDDECENCFGHVEKRRKKKPLPGDEYESDDDQS